MPSDEYLTLEVPRLRRAQERTYQAIDFTLAMIDTQRDKAYHSGPNPRIHEIHLADASASMPGTPEPSAPQDRTALYLATAGLYVEALSAISRSHAVVHKRPKLAKGAVQLLDTVTKGLNDVCSDLQMTLAPLYGDNDPLTAAWLLPIAHRGTGFATLLTDNLDKGIERAANGANVLTGISKGTDPGEVDANTIDSHGWTVLCILGARQVTPIYDWALTEIQDQLSKQLSGESVCDPAHLVCCLAIALRLGPVSLWTIDRIVKMVGEVQRPNGSWVIERPFIINHRGQTSRPIAAELMLGAMSVIEELDRWFPEDSTAGRLEYTLLDSLQRQREWLYATAVSQVVSQGQRGGPAWHSEYVRLKAGRLHTWATARITQALTRLLDIENRLVTRRLLEESGFTSQPGDKLPKSFAGIVDPELGKQDSSYIKLRERLAVDPPFRVTESTQVALKDGVTPSSRVWNSVVMFGPPGSSKTTLAQAVAKQLGWWLVSLSPSDFLIGGPDVIENRAKRIFDYLVQLEEAVVLFDEIDRLLLDRDSDAYKNQTDVFKFMTPSMLPKLSALHDVQGVKFIISTNYGEQLDPAITRRDRVDETLMISAPNLAARQEMLKEQKNISPGRLEDVAKATPLWVYGELKGLSEEDSDEIIAARPPVIDLKDYRQRLRAEFRRIDLVAMECLYLGQLKAAVNKDFDEDESEALKLAFIKAETSVAHMSGEVAQKVRPTLKVSTRLEADTQPNCFRLRVWNPSGTPQRPRAELVEIKDDQETRLLDASQLPLELAWTNLPEGTRPDLTKLDVNGQSVAVICFDRHPNAAEAELYAYGMNHRPTIGRVLTRFRDRTIYVTLAISSPEHPNLGRIERRLSLRFNEMAPLRFDPVD